MKRITFKSLSQKLAGSRHVPCVLAVGLLLSGSSCSSVRQYVRNVFEKDQPAIASSAESSGADAKTANSDAASADHEAGTTATAPQAQAPDKTAVVAQLKPDQQARLREAMSSGASADPFANASFSDEKPTIRQTAVEVEKASPDAGTSPTIEHEPVPREALENPFAAKPCPPAAACEARPFPGSPAGPADDELICDGGDNGLPVHYEGVERAGLEPEDTVAEFKDEEGNAHVQPSTEVCVYAPRFGAVSSATAPHEDLSIDRAQGHHDNAGVAGLDAKMVADQEIQSDEPVGIDMRSRASGLEAEAVDSQVHQNVAAENHVTLTNAYEDFRFIREGRFDRASTAVIGQGIDAAKEWADGRRPIIIAHDQAGQLVQGRFTAQDFTGVKEPDRPGELALLKVADKTSAHPGDIITFTIRFDNMGDRDLFEVRVVDNLSPRLVYVEGSVSSDRAGSVNVEQNGRGGQLLTFEFDEPLQGAAGGFISFQCRVR